MIYLGEFLADNTFMTRDTFPAADIIVFAGLTFVEFAKVEMRQNRTHLDVWSANVAACPGVAT